MEYIPCGGGQISSAAQATHRVLWIQEAHYCVHRAATAPALRHINPVPALLSYLTNICFNILFPLYA